MSNRKDLIRRLIAIKEELIGDLLNKYQFSQLVQECIDELSKEDTSTIVLGDLIEERYPDAERYISVKPYEVIPNEDPGRRVSRFSGTRWRSRAYCASQLKSEQQTAENRHSSWFSFVSIDKVEVQESAYIIHARTPGDVWLKNYLEQKKLRDAEKRRQRKKK